MDAPTPSPSIGSTPSPHRGTLVRRRLATHWLGQFALLAVLVTGAIGTLYGRQSIKWEHVQIQTTALNDVVYLPGKTALRAASLGFLPFAADLVFVRTHAYFLEHFSYDRIFAWLETYTDAILTLDPDYRDVYQWVSSVIRLGQEIDEATIAKSNHYAEMGAERFPDDPRFYEMLGFNKYFELRPKLKEREVALSAKLAAAPEKDKAALLAEVTAVRQERYALERGALEDMTIAAMLPGSTVDALFLVSLYVKQDDVGVAKQLTRTLMADARPEVRSQLLLRLEELGDTEAAAELRAADDRHRSQFPYIDDTLFALVGSSADLQVPTDWNRLGRAIESALGSLEARQAADQEPTP